MSQTSDSPNRIFRKLIVPLKRLRLVEKYQLFFTAVVAFSTVVAMCSTIVAVFQLKETHRDLVVSQRPWLGVSQPIELSGLSLDPKDAKASYTIKVKNFGASVATHVNLSTRAVVRSDQIYPAKKLTCEEAVSAMRATTFVPGQGVVDKSGGGAIFPSQEGEAQVGNLRIERPDADVSKLLFVVGCIEYDDQFGEIHQTQFMYWSGGDATALKLPTQLTPFLTSNNPE